MSSYIDVVHPERHAPYLDIPDDVVEAAKRRLGRSGANGNKVHTAKANTQGKDTGQSRSPTQT